MSVLHIAAKIGKHSRRTAACCSNSSKKLSSRGSNPNLRRIRICPIYGRCVNVVVADAQQPMGGGADKTRGIDSRIRPKSVRRPCARPQRGIAARLPHLGSCAACSSECPTVFSAAARPPEVPHARQVTPVLLVAHNESAAPPIPVIVNGLSDLPN
jgi:hypothetical protein